jgi:LmbE family N-acetylglucosaminyl deacetylase
MDVTSGESESVLRGRALHINALASNGPLTTNLPNPSRALAVGAHPDDIEFGCGGTLAKWAAGGCSIHHLVLTDGSKGSWDPGRDEAVLVATRQREQREAARRLGGGDVHFLSEPDGGLRNGAREQYEVCRVIRSVRPDVVLGHDPWRRYRLHPDHRNAGFILTDALVAARDPHFFPEQQLAPHRPRALLLWEADVPNHVEDVTDFATTKVQALLAHESQYESTMGIADEANGSPEDFAASVLEQLREHGSLAGIPLEDL